MEFTWKDGAREKLGTYSAPPKSVQKSISKEYKAEQRAIKNKNSFFAKQRRASAISGGKLIIAILLCLFFIYIFMHFNDNNFQVPTFADLLTRISNLPLVQIPSITLADSLSSIPIIGDFLNVVTGLANVLLFLLNGVVNLVQYVYSLISWLFGLSS